MSLVGVEEARVELELDAEPDAAPRARRFAAGTLAGQRPELVSAAELVVTELVTNALLHAQAPIVLRVYATPAGARVEVSDGGRDLPLTPRLTPFAMTGRGLALVAAFATSWGVEPGTGGGKTVWAELRVNGDERPAPLQLSHAPLRRRVAEQPLYTVRIEGVPTILLVSVEGHTDNVVRDLRLALAAESLDPATEDRLHALISALTVDIASPRAEGIRQGLDAEKRGDGVITAVFTAPASAITAAERYLWALDEADLYARSAQLLTLEAPPVLRVFRRWLAHRFIDALRAEVGQWPAPVAVTFEAALAAEVTRLSSLGEAATRLSALQRVTGALAHAHSLDDIAGTVITEATERAGAMSARVYLRRGDLLCSLARRGADSIWAQKYDEFPLTADLPGAEVFRTKAAMVLRGRAQMAERYPVLADVYPDERALHVAPLIVGSECIGVLSMAFPLVGVDDVTQSIFVSTLADTLAQTLGRALGLERLAESNTALAQANDRLAFLADASVLLSGSLDYQATLDEVAQLMVPRFADWCSVQMLDDDLQLRTIALTHSDPVRIEWAREIGRRYPTRMDSGFGAAEVIRTGRSELYPDISASMLQSAALDAEHLSLINEIPLSSALVVPLNAGSETLGAISLVYAESGRRYAPADVPFVEDIARRAAAALKSATAFREQTGRLADVQRVADAAQLAILAPPPPRIGPVALAARYVAAAAEAQVGGDLYEVAAAPGAVRLLIGDVRGKGLAAVRTATIVLGEFRAVASDLTDLAAIATRLDRRLRPYLGPEDFVTALLAEIRDDGGFSLISCGHPPPLVLTRSQIREVETPACLPLGLGPEPESAVGTLAVGERLLLYTDGAIEARDSRRRFIDLESVLRPGLERDLPGVVDALVSGLRRRIGRARLGDDLALLIAEYRGP